MDSSRESARVMTIGTLSRRTGVPVKTLREYEDFGLIYTVGRSAGNYRLFGDEALWCVGVVASLRGLGLTLAEIHELASSYLGLPGDPIGPRLAEIVLAVRARTEERIASLQALLHVSTTMSRSTKPNSLAAQIFVCSTRAHGVTDLTLPLEGDSRGGLHRRRLPQLRGAEDLLSVQCSCLDVFAASAGERRGDLGLGQASCPVGVRCAREQLESFRRVQVVENLQRCCEEVPQRGA